MENHRRVFYHEFWLMKEVQFCERGSDFVTFGRESATMVAKGGNR